MTSTADIEYRPDQLPARTLYEQLRRELGFGIAKLGAGAIAWLVGFAALGWPGIALGGLAAFLVVGLVYGYIRESAMTEMQEIERRWRTVLHACGRIFPQAHAEQPPVRLLNGTILINEVAIKLPDGMTPEKLAAQQSAIANAWGVPGVKLYSHLGGWYRLVLLADMPPTPPEVVEVAPVEHTPAVPRTWKSYLSALPVGTLYRHTAPGYVSAEQFAAYPHMLVEPGKVLPVEWGLPLLGSHVLAAGQTGAGKSSWTQAIISALRPVMAHGAAVLVGIDPKGVELALGRGFFRHYASDYDSIADTLEMVVAEMTKRKQQMAGKSRLVRPCKETPLWVIFIDELAAVGKLDVDAKRRNRTTAAMNLILTQGRALGFSVVGSVQDPTKDTVPNRDLFNLRIALRLTASMADLVLGPKSREEGAAAHLLTAEWAGAGYLHDGSGWALVRAHWVDDDDIVRQAAEFIDGAYQRDTTAVFLPVDEGSPPPPVVHPPGMSEPVTVNRAKCPCKSCQAASGGQGDAQATAAPADDQPSRTADDSDDAGESERVESRGMPRRSFIVNVATVGLGAASTERVKFWSQHR